MNEYQLISEIYRLVGDSDSRTLTNAVKLVDDQHMLRILNAFAALRERSSSFAYPQPTASSQHIHEVGHPPLDITLRDPPGRSFGDKLMSATSGLSSAQTLKLLRDSGLEVRANPKDGRQKIVSRAMRMLITFPKSRYDQVISRLARQLSSTQTAGWINLIRSDDP